MFYASDNMTSLSRIHFKDPLSFRNILYKNNLSLQGIQLSDDGEITSCPAASYLYLQQIDSNSKPESIRYEELQKAVCNNPYITAEDEGFHELKEKIVTRSKNLRKFFVLLFSNAVSKGFGGKVSENNYAFTVTTLRNHSSQILTINN